MATVPAKKPRKRYLHHSSELAVPKTTFYRRGQNAQSLQEAKSLAGPSHSACGNAESSTYTGDIPSSCTSNSGLQETSPVMAAESALLDESEESDTTAFDDGGSPPRYCEDEVLATAFASLSSQELPNLGTSKAGAAAMAMSFAISDGLTWTALGDLAALVNAIAGVDVLPRKKYKFRKLAAEYLGSDDLTLTINTDGTPVFKSSKTSVWPLQIVVNELPAATRLQNPILIALWFGSTHRNMQAFLANSVDNLKKMDPIVWKTESKVQRSNAFVLC
ncbi:hypothetical protein HPB50_018225 [Hyalomma asiaticum]|uniref:Uncharacterized protein n=1 Tax=Hyalomma asiaticum TaxID=266040 RepID=A0ACB7RJC6_HYAAI|nr:hypothetical protein HPB50_018225 [Hyalomma asiaticum]